MITAELLLEALEPVDQGLTTSCLCNHLIIFISLFFPAFNRYPYLLLHDEPFKHGQVPHPKQKFSLAQAISSQQPPHFCSLRDNFSKRNPLFSPYLSHVFIQPFQQTFSSILTTSKAVPAGVIYGLCVTKLNGQSGTSFPLCSLKHQESSLPFQSLLFLWLKECHSTPLACPTLDDQPPRFVAFYLTEEYWNLSQLLLPCPQLQFLYHLQCNAFL